MPDQLVSVQQIVLRTADGKPASDSKSSVMTLKLFCTITSGANTFPQAYNALLGLLSAVSCTEICRDGYAGAALYTTKASNGGSKALSATTAGMAAGIAGAAAGPAAEGAGAGAAGEVWTLASIQARCALF